MRSRQKVKILRAIVSKNYRDLKRMDTQLDKTKESLLNAIINVHKVEDKLKESDRCIMVQQIHIEELKAELNRKQSFKGRVAALFS